MALLLHPVAPLAAMALVKAPLLCYVVSAGGGGSSVLTTIMAAGWALMLISWMDADARRFGRLPCYDFGLLAAVFFPLSLLWYCLWSRGWRGMLVLLLLFGLWVAPYLFAVIFAVFARL